jgi:monoamine oxidase
MFHKSRLQPEKRRGEPGSYVELVVSASKSMVEMQRQEIIDLALRNWRNSFPWCAGEAGESRGGERGSRHLLHSSAARLIRPSPASPWPRVFLAGDWIATGWPATMEGAVRSGYMAAEA